MQPRFCCFCGSSLVARQRADTEPARFECGTCGETSYSSPSLLVNAYVFAEDHLLLIRRGLDPYRGKWASPGGFVERHEALDSAIAREVFEETSLRVPGARYLPFGVISLPRINQVYVSFLLRLGRKVDVRGIPPETTAAEWFSESNYPAQGIWEPEAPLDVRWLFRVARSEKREFFHRTELSIRTLNASVDVKSLP